LKVDYDIKENMVEGMRKMVKHAANVASCQKYKGGDARVQEL
jgi:hypothetical protein